MDGSTLTCTVLRGIAEDGARVRISPAALARVADSHATALAVAAGRPVYGRTTGVGANRAVAVTDPDAGMRLLRSHAAGASPLLAPTVARAMVAVRLNQLAAGGSGVAPATLTALADALNRGLAPTAYAMGGIGTGDLTALACTALCLLGELPWRGGDLPPVAFDPADALGFLSSNAATIGEAGLACVELRDLLDASTVVTALSFAAAQGNLEAYDPAVHRSPVRSGRRAVAAQLHALLADGAGTPARIQDPFGFRAAPQVHGPALDASKALECTVTDEMNAAHENPLVVDGRVLHNGNFHTAALGLALDAARAALYQTAALSVSRTAALMEPSITGLRPFLAGGPPGSSGVLILEYVTRSALAQLRHEATPAALDTAVLSRGAEDHAPFSTQSARNTTRALAPYRTILAAELVTAVRALRLRGVALGPGPLREAFDLAALLPAGTCDRRLDTDLAQAAGMLARTPERSEGPFLADLPACAIDSRHAGVPAHRAV